GTTEPAPESRVLGVYNGTVRLPVESNVVAQLLRSDVNREVGESDTQGFIIDGPEA
ncbi:hypothetical protein AAVH_35810, partial [Aphelenchoides avenae]